MRPLRFAALATVALFASSAARAESGSALNVHVEPGAAIPTVSPGSVPVGQGVALKLDFPLFEGFAIQANGTALSFRANSDFLGDGSGIGGGT